MFVEKMHFPHKDVRPDLPDDYVYWSMLVPSRLLGPTEEMLTQALQWPPHELSLMLTSEWDPSIRCLAELQDRSQAAALRIITTVPDLPKWASTSRVTLLEDSIHVMSPAGGVGAATALQDAATLTKILARDGLSTASIREYEDTMREYAKAALTRSFRGGKKLFGQPPYDQRKEVAI
ncbi:hypothetical protein VTN77DRAFT_8041 [Rasamsonia byssochlamydoides]|uniref:uncharacterized protein n=1 Tax=Rasamsonia byssochlamydoides TaxID=89139 RepID=UPI0037446331